LGVSDGQTLPELGGSLIFSVPDVSFSVPVRKKLRLEGVHGGVRGLDPAGNIEVSMAWNVIGTKWNHEERVWSWYICPDYAFCLPVPDRAKPQYNFVVIPKPDIPNVEAIVLTAPEANSKAPNAQQGPDAITQNLNSQLGKFGKQVISPSDAEFVSQPSSTKGIKTYGIRAHRGSKEGTYYS
jgi:hypothetical protein